MKFLDAADLDFGAFIQFRVGSADGFEVGGGDFLGIQKRLIEDDGGIERGVDFEISVEALAAGDVAFGANQRRAAGSGSGESLALPGVGVGGRVENLHGLANVVDDDHGMIEEIPAENAMGWLAGGFGEIFLGDDWKGADAQLQSGHG